MIISWYYLIRCVLNWWLVLIHASKWVIPYVRDIVSCKIRCLNNIKPCWQTMWYLICQGMRVTLTVTSVRSWETNARKIFEHLAKDQNVRSYQFQASSSRNRLDKEVLRVITSSFLSTIGRLRPPFPMIPTAPIHIPLAITSHQYTRSWLFPHVACAQLLK